MARARNIKPSFFSNELLGECQPLARLLFAGLWCWADRSGRLEERPARLKAEILPYDNCDVGRLLAELANRHFIVRYEVAGCKYIQITKFNLHQNPHVKERASTIPAPGLHHTSPADSLIRIPSSGFLIPESGIPILRANDVGTANEVETEGEPPAKPTADPVYPTEFSDFWEAYPNRGGRKRGKQKAFSLWKAVPVTARRDLVQAARSYASSSEAERGFSRDPERFLKDGWWREWLEKPATQCADAAATDGDWVRRLRERASKQVQEDLRS